MSAPKAMPEPEKKNPFQTALTMGSGMVVKYCDEQTPLFVKKMKLVPKILYVAMFFAVLFVAIVYQASLLAECTEESGCKTCSLQLNFKENKGLVCEPLAETLLSTAYRATGITVKYANEANKIAAEINKLFAAVEAINFTESCNPNGETISLDDYVKWTNDQMPSFVGSSYDVTAEDVIKYFETYKKFNPEWSEAGRFLGYGLGQDVDLSDFAQHQLTQIYDTINRAFRQFNVKVPEIRLPSVAKSLEVHYGVPKVDPTVVFTPCSGSEIQRIVSDLKATYSGKGFEFTINRFDQITGHPTSEEGLQANLHAQNELIAFLSILKAFGNSNSSAGLAYFRSTHTDSETAEDKENKVTVNLAKYPGEADGFFSVSAGNAPVVFIDIQKDANQRLKSIFKVANYELGKGVTHPKYAAAADFRVVSSRLASALSSCCSDMSVSSRIGVAYGFGLSIVAIFGAVSFWPLLVVSKYLYVEGVQYDLKAMGKDTYDKTKGVAASSINQVFPEGEAEF